MHACLAIDTTGEYCTAALRQAGLDDFVLSERIGRGHAERLAPMVEALLAEAGVTPREIGRIGVATGPGSFAGTRVGTAFTRGLALATGAAAVGVSNFAVIARMTDPRGDARVAVLHDAKRGEILVQAFDQGRAEADPLRLDLAGAKDWLAPRLDAGVRSAGSGASVVLTALGAARAEDDVTEPLRLDPRVLLDLAETSDAPPSPFYARPPDAKLPGGVTPA